MDPRGGLRDGRRRPHGDGAQSDDGDDSPWPTGRPRPPGAETGGAPRLPLRRWNPYRNLTPSNRQFVKDLLRFPTVTASMIVLLAFIYVWMLAEGWEFTVLRPSRWGYSLAVTFGALEPDLVRAGEWWRLFTPALLHGSLIHLGFNGFMLYQLGRLTENVFGKLGFAILFVGSAVAGCTLSAFVGDNLSVGASGAVMGMVGASIAFGLKHRGEIPEFLQGVFRGTLYFYAVLIFAIGLLPGVDGWGHAGGFFGGFAIGMILPARILHEEQRRTPGWVLLLFAGATGFAGVCVGMVLPGAVSFDADAPAEAFAAFDAAVENERWERAGRALDEAEAIEGPSPNLATMRMVLAEMALIDEQWAVAVDQYDRIDRELLPSLYGGSGFLNNRAWAIFMAWPRDPDRVDQGVALSRESLVDDPENAVYLNTLAWGLYLQGDPHGALAAIEDAMRVNDGDHLDSDIYVYVACLHAVGREAEAVSRYREAVATVPGGVLHTEVAAILAGTWGEDDAVPAEPPAESHAADEPVDPVEDQPAVARDDDDSAEAWTPPPVLWD